MRSFKKKFKRPKRPYDSSRISEEGNLLHAYGLRRKREIWTSQDILRNYRRRARELIATRDEEKVKRLIDKVVKMGLLTKGGTLDDVLGLTVEDVLNRRLQTIVWKKGLTNTPKQARQYIVHGHVMIDGRSVTSPSYLLPPNEESKIKLHLNAKAQKTEGGSE